MRLYKSLQETMRAAFARKDKQVIAILCINSKSYFIFRSKLSPDQSINEALTAKFLIGNKIKKDRFSSCETDSDLPENLRSTNAIDRLKAYLKNSVLSQSLPNTISLHAEENLILKFPEAVKLFNHHFPHERINNIQIFLSHSPCAPSANRNCSTIKNKQHLNHQGCEMKLKNFFKNTYRETTDPRLFESKPKIQVKYYYLFDSNHSYRDDYLIKEADESLKRALQPLFK